MPLKPPQTIEVFSEEGEAKDQEAILRVRKQVEQTIEEKMREKGYVPVWDNLPQLYWEYDSDRETFYFRVDIYGTFLGEEGAQMVNGIFDGKPIFFEPNPL